MADRLRDGCLIDSATTINLLQAALERTPSGWVLVDGFPRNLENLEAWHATPGVPQPECILYLDCPCATLQRRLLKRQDGRADDTPETIQRRIRIFEHQTGAVLRYYGRRQLLRTVDAQKPM
ncbi:hypothetical protein EBT31_17355, partial [bacterium]|nr:hypothetical protein [bacterium]